ncbi:MAG: potassium channel family protein [Tissierella sp.]|uniref:potassium channel family protein n=1 Tax=Tissierella sp. TaxID=41274 RepID=UPI003F975CDD
MKSFAVIGLGRFGTAVSKVLSELGNEVLAIDKDPEVIREVSSIVTYAVEADVMDETVLRDLGIGNIDAVVVSIGSDLQASIMATLVAKELGVKRIVAKAQTELHGKVLKKIGADRLIFPERDMGSRVAHNLTSRNILDYIEISPEFSILEIEALKTWVGKDLKGLRLRNKYGVNVIAIKRGEKVNVSPSSEDEIKTGDIVIIIGSTEDVKKIEMRVGE